MLKTTRFEAEATPQEVATYDDVPAAMTDAASALAAVLNNPQAPVHKIQKGRSKNPFFFLHGDWNGGPFYCVTLARTMGREQPFYALDPYKFSGPYLPLSFPEMAAVYVKAVRTIQPEGPYLLGGFCNGALVAHEIARQLQEQGQQVSLLLLITPTRVKRTTQAAHHIIHRAGAVLHINERQQLHAYLRLRHAVLHMYRRLHPPEGPFKKDFLKMMTNEPRLKKMFPPVEALYNDYSGMYTWLAGTYSQTFNEESIKFVWSSEEAVHRPLWSAFEHDTQATPIIPGPHMACITDHLDTLASVMKDYVQEAHG
jgi:hypothetical protein